MPFLKSLVREAVRRAAQNPRVQETAKQVYADEIKPRAKEAWDRAKPEVEAAKAKALQGAAKLARRVQEELEKSADAKGKPKEGGSAEPPERP